MDFLYEKIIRPTLFRVNPERAHEYGRNLLQTASLLQPVCNWLARQNQGSQKPISLMGLEFPNLVGLAAGMDKDGEFVPGSAALGFGHIEVGTVTPLAQPGNPQPRLFRYPPEEAIVNRMGFNNRGVGFMKRKLSKLPVRGKRPYVLGVNIGKNKKTPLDEAEADYLTCFRELSSVADYFTVNVSSPNTEGLRELQQRKRLLEILGALQQANQLLGEKRVPILLKIAPDLAFSQIDEILGVIEETRIEGIVATNTTLGRPEGSDGRYESGGLSGKPLGYRSTEVIRYISKATQGKLPLIGVGGINGIADAGEKMDAGAHLVQIYTGWIYRGPWFAKVLAKGLRSYQQNW